MIEAVASLEIIKARKEFGNVTYAGEEGRILVCRT
jgi:hypothetical protein